MRTVSLILILLAFVQFSAAQDTKENADFKLAVSLYNDKFYDLALEQFRQFVATYPNTPQGTEARFYLGLSQLQLKQFEEARFTFQNFALMFREHPRASEAWWNVADAYLKLGNFREAALAYERVKTFHPKSKLAPAALLESAKYFQLAGDRESSKKVLRALGQEFASADVVPEGRLQLARIYYSERQYELARAETKKAAEAANDASVVVPALQLMAESLLRLGRFEEAKTVLNESIARFRAGAPYFEFLLALGRLHRTTGDLDGAMQTWGIIVDPKSPSPDATRQAAFVELGDARVGRGSMSDALTAYEGAIRLDGLLHGEACFKAARTAERLGQTSKAGELYLKAAGDSATTFDRRSILVAGFRGAKFQKKYLQALRLAQQFQQEFPSDRNLPRVLFEAGNLVAADLGDPRRSLEFYEEVTSLGENELSDEAMFAMAKSLRQAGALSEALQALERLEKQFPASELLPLAREERFSITTYEMKDREGGIRNLALLIGDVIAAKPRGELAFRLGEIYFNDLKEYENAAVQYEAALRGDLDRQVRAGATFRKARALEFQAFRNAGSPEKYGSAIAAYDAFLMLFPTSEHSADARFSMIRLQLRRTQTSVELRNLAANLRGNLEEIRNREQLWLALGESFQAVKSQGDAAAVFAELLRMKPGAEAEARALVRLAEAKFELGERDTAAPLLESYLRKFPSHELSAKARFMLAGVEVDRGRIDRALQLYLELEQRSPYSRYAQGLDLARGDAYYRAGDVANALILYQNYAQELLSNSFSLQDPTADLLAKMADCYRRTGNRLEAKKLYADVLARDTSSAVRAGVYTTLALIAQEEKNLEAAARYLQEASRYGTGTPEQRLRAAVESADLLFQSEDYKTAIARYNDLLPQANTDSLRRLLDARIIVGYFRLDNAVEADRRANAFVKAHPNARDQAAEFEFERGRFHLRRDETDLAIRRLENVRQRFPQSPIVPETVYWLARALELKNQPERAVQLYDSLIQKFPDNPIIPRVQLSLGNVYYNLEQWDAAARQYKAILDNPQHGHDLHQFAMSNLIMAYKEIGLFDAALQLTRQYIDRFPEDPDLVMKRIDIGVIYQKLGYYDQSILHLQAMLENATPELEGELRYYIGEAYFYKGGYQQAILEFLKVPYLITKQTRVDWVATSYYMAGQSYEKMSKFDQAITMYKQIIERPGIDPTFKTAAQKEIDRVNALVRAK
ncbi:MAG: tetratricopeptide repeat protein [Ignavibacteriales bacterium]|nr:tetratricopeptide repeat protein [Ignavibacteriales bacterium]